MELYLSSHGLGKASTKLPEMITGPMKAVLVMNAQDSITDTNIRDRNAEVLASGLEALGFDVDRVDLREFFEDSVGLVRRLQHCSLLWMAGGNAFLLRRAMRQSGLDQHIRAQSIGRRLVYAGHSAGACVAGPTLRGIDLVDDPCDIVGGYDSPVIWEGLGLVSYSIAPHYQSDHPESSAIDGVVDYFSQHGMPYRALKDGEVIITTAQQQVAADGATRRR